MKRFFQEDSNLHRITRDARNREISNSHTHTTTCKSSGKGTAATLAVVCELQDQFKMKSAIRSNSEHNELTAKGFAGTKTGLSYRDNIIGQNPALCKACLVGR